MVIFDLAAFAGKMRQTRKNGSLSTISSIHVEVLDVVDECACILVGQVKNPAYKVGILITKNGRNVPNGSHQLVSELLKQALPGGGWSGRGDNASITVTSEAILALAEHIEQTPVPGKEEEKKKREEQINTLTKSIGIVLTELNNRDESDLDVVNCAMGLAAYCQYRVLGLRESITLLDPDKALISKLLKVMVSSQPDPSTADIGVIWAYLRAVQFVRRTRFAVEDQALWDLLSNADQSGHSFGNVLSRADSVTRAVLSRVQAVTDGYKAAVVMDIAVEALRSKLRGADRTNAIEAATTCLDCVFQLLESVSPRGEFPIHFFEGPRDPDSSPYVVVTEATLLNCFAFLLHRETDVPGPSLTDEERTRVQLYFYMAAAQLDEIIRSNRLWGYGPAHCIRVLSEIQLNDRDAAQAKEVLLREAHTRNAARFRGDFVREVADFLDRSPTRIGSPSSDWLFFCTTNRLFLTVAGGLFLTQALAMLFLLTQRYVLSGISIGVASVMILVPFAWYAFSNTFALHQRDERSRQKAIFGFIIFAAVIVLPNLVTLAFGFDAVVDLFKTKTSP